MEQKGWIKAEATQRELKAWINLRVSSAISAPAAVNSIP
jgi:hypothetical protein